MKKLLYVTLLIVLTFSLSIPVFAKSDTCGKSGCINKKDSNGTIYCNFHAAQYVREQGYKACCASGCYRRRQSDGFYCSQHTCEKKDCDNKATSSDGKYCSSHEIKKVEKKKTYSSSKKSTSSSKKSTNKNSTKKTKKKSSWESYDDGYNDIYEDDDYDWDRYWDDDDYASGVDDAMDEMDW